MSPSFLLFLLLSLCLGAAGLAQWVTADISWGRGGRRCGIGASSDDRGRRQ